MLPGGPRGGTQNGIAKGNDVALEGSRRSCGDGKRLDLGRSVDKRVGGSGGPGGVGGSNAGLSGFPVSGWDGEVLRAGEAQGLEDAVELAVDAEETEAGLAIQMGGRGRRWRGWWLVIEALFGVEALQPRLSLSLSLSLSLLLGPTPPVHWLCSAPN